jgi:hypothetical protein
MERSRARPTARRARSAGSWRQARPPKPGAGRGGGCAGNSKQGYRHCPRGTMASMGLNPWGEGIANGFLFKIEADFLAVINRAQAICMVQIGQPAGHLVPLFLLPISLSLQPNKVRGWDIGREIKIVIVPAVELTALADLERQGQKRHSSASTRLCHVFQGERSHRTMAVQQAGARTARG